ncbi:MAG TPA: glycosyltransferase family 39 protein [Terriglobales bacterium]|nr:glycosyltransferase family 39 protein [Terriglobales bacterium]
MSESKAASKQPISAMIVESVTVVGFCAFLFFYGLGSFGLVGADEPRYAQIAREMLARHDWVTPVLNGSAWLEKPIFYYWGAMLSYMAFGVSDWAARMPSAVMASGLVLAVYLFLRRFRPGSQVDGALIVATSVSIIGFARAASTDMPLASMFGISLLAWYVWLETDQKRWLATAYIFLALATLAKGPVAPFLALLIVVVFCALLRDFKVLGRMLWAPGLALYFAVMLPWYVLVQVRNPQFLRVFLLEHNLARFGTNMFQHQQPWWYFIPVLLISVLPWTIVVLIALFRSVRRVVQVRLGGAATFELFLLLWGVLPIVFFSISESKLPGYILPAIPAFGILLADYLLQKREQSRRAPVVLVILHSLLSGTMLSGALLVWFWISRVKPISGAIVAAGIVGAAIALVMIVVMMLRGVAALRLMTLVPVVLGMAFLIKMGAPVMDLHLSTRLLAAEIHSMEPARAPVAVYGVKREIQYGLNFYRNEQILNYQNGEIPQLPHILVVPQGKIDEAQKMAPGWSALKLGEDVPQKLDLYWMQKAEPGSQP